MLLFVRSKSTGVGVGDGLYPGEIVDRTGLFPLIEIVLVLIFPTNPP